MPRNDIYETDLSHIETYFFLNEKASPEKCLLLPASSDVVCQQTVLSLTPAQSESVSSED
jgi:hypothetical protein